MKQISEAVDSFGIPIKENDDVLAFEKDLDDSIKKTLGLEALPYRDEIVGYINKLGLDGGAEQFTLRHPEYAAKIAQLKTLLKKLGF